MRDLLNEVKLHNRPAVDAPSQESPSKGVVVEEYPSAPGSSVDSPRVDRDPFILENKRNSSPSDPIFAEQNAVLDQMARMEKDFGKEFKVLSNENSDLIKQFSELKEAASNPFNRDITDVRVKLGALRADLISKREEIENRPAPKEAIAALKRLWVGDGLGTDCQKFSSEVSRSTGERFRAVIGKVESIFAKPIITVGDINQLERIFEPLLDQRDAMNSELQRIQLAKPSATKYLN